MYILNYLLYIPKSYVLLNSLLRLPFAVLIRTIKIRNNKRNIKLKKTLEATLERIIGYLVTYYSD